MDTLVTPQGALAHVMGVASRLIASVAGDHSGFAAALRQL